MPTASSDRRPAIPQAPRPLPEYFRNFQQRFGTATQRSADPAAVKQRNIVPSIAPRPEPRPDFPWHQRLRAWLVSPDGRACGVSLLLHGTLLLCLSLIALRPGRGNDLFGVSLRQGEPDFDRSGLENILGEGIETSGGSVEIESASVVAAPYAPQEAIRPEVDLETTVSGLDLMTNAAMNPSELLREFDESSGAGRGRGTGTGVGNGIGNLTDGFSKPGGGRVVRKGKFTAWTVPADPKPMQNYLIVIEVAWPKTTDKKLIRSRRNDVTGTVHGTDSYYQVIEQLGHFIPKSNQVVVPVPGAQQNVQDVIRVRSKLLNESQELTITF